MEASHPGRVCNPAAVEELPDPPSAGSRVRERSAPGSDAAPSLLSFPPSLSALSPAAPARARPSPVRAAGGAAGGAPARPGPAPRRWNRAPGSLARRAGCTPDPPAAPAEPGPARFGHGAARGPTAGERRAGTSPGHRRGGGDGAGSAGTAHLATAESCQVFGTESAELKSPPFAT